jgi:Transcriptional regulators
MKDPREIFGPITLLYQSQVEFLTKELKEYNIGPSHVEFLMILYHKDGVSQDKIAKTFKVSKATSTRIVQSLEKEGYVYRERDENDSRAYKVYLTEKGKQLKHLILEKMSSFVDTLFFDLTPQEREIFRMLIIKASTKFLDPNIEFPNVDVPNLSWD